MPRPLPKIAPPWEKLEAATGVPVDPELKAEATRYDTLMATPLRNILQKGLPFGEAMEVASLIFHRGDEVRKAQFAGLTEITAPIAGIRCLVVADMPYGPGDEVRGHEFCYAIVEKDGRLIPDSIWPKYFGRGMPEMFGRPGGRFMYYVLSSLRLLELNPELAVRSGFEGKDEVRILQGSFGCPSGQHAGFDPYEGTNREWHESARGDGQSYSGVLETVRRKPGESDQDFGDRVRAAREYWEQYLACPRCYR